LLLLPKSLGVRYRSSAPWIPSSRLVQAGKAAQKPDDEQDYDHQAKRASKPRSAIPPVAIVATPGTEQENYNDDK
jgi:hypothetical protein